MPIFKEETKLGLQDDQAIYKNPSEEYCKNFRENTHLKKTDINSRIFLISEKPKAYNWKLHQETKKTGDYTCFKATHSEELDDIKQIENADGSFSQKVVEVSFKITVWYSPELPIMNGPREFGNLPELKRLMQ